jgi:hypothetical protein
MFAYVDETAIGNGTGSWAEAYAKAKVFVGQLSLQDKVWCSSHSPTVKTFLLTHLAGESHGRHPGQDILLRQHSSHSSAQLPRFVSK